MRRKQDFSTAKNNFPPRRVVYLDPETNRKLDEIQRMFDERYPNKPTISLCFTQALNQMYDQIKNEPGALNELYTDFTTMGYAKNQETMADALHAHKDELQQALKHASE